MVGGKAPLYTQSRSKATGVLLGPQRLAVTVNEELEALAIKGEVAAITAGWQEREAEDEELQAALGNRAVNLMLHARSDAVGRDDPELFVAHRAKQDRLRQLQALYRGRLAHAITAARELQAAAGDRALIESELEAAIEAIRVLDDQHLARIKGIEDEYDDAMRPQDRPVVQAHREALAEIIGRAGAVAIAGGHVVSLLTRLRLFDLAPLIAGRPILAWSAGAMCLTDRVVLFHDSPPQGQGIAEILEAGLGLFPGLVVFPHARRRLRLSDPARVALLAGRFGPAACVALDERCKVTYDGHRLCAAANTMLLDFDGLLRPMEPRCP
jgi:hypothetical protein